MSGTMNLLGRKVAAHALAAQFMLDLLDEIGSEKFGRACQRNATIGAGMCASHDFCDANVVMSGAWEGAFEDQDPMNLNDEADLELWNAAWKIATEAMAAIGRVHRKWRVSRATTESVVVEAQDADEAIRMVNSIECRGDDVGWEEDGHDGSYAAEPEES